MAVKIVTFFQTYGSESPDDLMGGLFGLIPEEIEPVNFKASKSPAGMVTVEITLAANLAEAEAVAREFVNAPGMPARDVKVRNRFIK